MGQRTVTRAILAVLVSACGSDRVVAPEAPSGPSAQLVVQGPPEGGVAIKVRASGAGTQPVSGLQGRVTWDPRNLTLLGQVTSTHIVMLNASRAEAGEVRFVAVAANGLPDVAAELRFLRRGSLTRMPTLIIEELVTRDLVVFPAVRILPTGSDLSAPAPAEARVLSAADWFAKVGEPVPATTRIKSIAGDGRIYGDATLSQTINAGDVVATSNVAVGNVSLLTEVTRDFAIAANVAPLNLPGLGESDDPVPPGRNADGTFSISVGDVTVIANEAVGNDQPVVGEPIPGRLLATNRVIVADSILANRTFFRDSIYEIQGTVIVGNPVVGDVTLTIQPGTLIEGDAATRGTLVIRRGANLVAVGTRLEPIVFTCTATMKTPGCWGGVVINGFSVLNNGSTSDDGTVGFPTKQGPGNTGRYGGTLIEDSSGVLRYARIEYAGAHPAGTGQALAGLRLLAVGSRTHIDSVQIRESLGEGIYVGGGTARLRNVVLTNNRLDGLSWEDGWQGAAQFLIVQLGTESRHGLRGANWLVNPNAGPRSAPILSNLTIVGPPNGTSGNAVLLEAGSGGRIFNAIVERAAAIGFDVSGNASCAVGGDSLDLRASLFLNAPGADFSGDSDCLDEVAFALTPARGNRILSPGLLAPLVGAAPDFRIASAGAALTGYQQPPPVVGEPFFDLTALYLGAVGPANTFGSNVPWYAGWTRGW